MPEPELEQQPEQGQEQEQEPNPGRPWISQADTWAGSRPEYPEPELGGGS